MFFIFSSKCTKIYLNKKKENVGSMIEKSIIFVPAGGQKDKPGVLRHSIRGVGGGGLKRGDAEPSKYANTFGEVMSSSHQGLLCIRIFPS